MSTRARLGIIGSQWATLSYGCGSVLSVHTAAHFQLPEVFRRCPRAPDCVQFCTEVLLHSIPRTFSCLGTSGEVLGRAQLPTFNCTELRLCIIPRTFDVCTSCTCLCTILYCDLRLYIIPRRQVQQLPRPVFMAVSHTIRRKMPLSLPRLWTSVAVRYKSRLQRCSLGAKFGLSSVLSEQSTYTLLARSTSAAVLSRTYTMACGGGLTWRATESFQILNYTFTESLSMTSVGRSPTPATRSGPDRSQAGRPSLCLSLSLSTLSLYTYTHTHRHTRMHTGGLNGVRSNASNHLVGAKTTAFQN